MGYYAMLRCVSLCNQCDIPHSGIVCDITPLQNFFFDITPVLSKAMLPYQSNMPCVITARA